MNYDWDDKDFRYRQREIERAELRNEFMTGPRAPERRIAPKGRRVDIARRQRHPRRGPDRSHQRGDSFRTYAGRRNGPDCRRLRFHGRRKTD